MRDVALNLCWVNRYAMTMYEKRPTRWRDVPRSRDDVFLPVLTPWEDGERKVAAVDAAYQRCRPRWDAGTEDRIFADAVRRLLPPPPPRDRAAADQPTVPRCLGDPASLTFSPGRLRPRLPHLLLRGDPRLRRGGAGARGAAPLGDGAAQPVPVGPRADAAEAVGDLARRRLRGRCSHPRNPDVMRLHPPRPGAARPRRAAGRAAHRSRAQPVGPYPAVRRRASGSACMPRLEALAAVNGEHVCTQRRPHPQHAPSTGRR